MLFYEDILGHYRSELDSDSSRYGLGDFDTEEERRKLAGRIHAYHFTEERLRRATIYRLAIRQAQLFQKNKFGFEDFPPLVHPALWIEFDGLLKFDYAPTIVEEYLIGGESLKALKRVRQDKSDCAYRGVCIYESRPPHPWENWPANERVIRAQWYEAPVSHLEEIRSKVYNCKWYDRFSLSWTESTWPRLLNEHHYTEVDPERAEGTLRHAYRLSRMTVNLLYFLAAENLVKVRIRPKDHHVRGKELSGLPKSEYVYHVLPFQLPRYRYLHPSEPGSGHAHGHIYDVRGHFRHLRDEHFERNPDGTIRIVWVQAHQRGLHSDVYLPTVRLGNVAGRILDYDHFVREFERRRVKQRLDKPRAEF
jgi:hypothetical protein